MISSYQLSERINFQVILWAMASAVYWPVAGLIIAVQWTWAIVVAGLVALAPYAGTLAKALALTAGLVAIAAAVACIPPTFWLGLAITGAFGWATYPRPKVRR